MRYCNYSIPPAFTVPVFFACFFLSRSLPTASTSFRSDPPSVNSVPSLMKVGSWHCQSVASDPFGAVICTGQKASVETQSPPPNSWLLVPLFTPVNCLQSFPSFQSSRSSAPGRFPLGPSNSAIRPSCVLLQFPYARSAAT